MIKKLVLALVIAILALVAFIYVQPADFKVERSTTVMASDSVVFAQINDFRNWEAWSPWAKLDTSMTVTYEGPESGTGAKYSWKGNSDVGSGTMLITKSEPNEVIEIQLDFIEPFASSNITMFTISGDSTQSTVTWTMTGQNNFLSKAFDLFFDVNKLIGADFEKGLQALKEVSEK